MKHTQSVSPYLVDEVVKVSSLLGLDATTAQHRAQINSARQTGGRIPLALFCLLLEDLVRQSGDPDIGLRIGQLLEPAGFNLLGHLVMTSDTIGDALRHVQQLQQLVIDCAQCVCEPRGDQLYFAWTPKQPLELGDKPLLDLLFSGIRTFGIWVTGVSEPFTEIQFQFAQPANTQRYLNVFGHRGCFSRTENGFMIPLTWSERPIKSASANLQPLIYQQALTQWESLRNQGSYASQIADVLAQLLPEGGATIERVSESMGLSARSLQRRLREQGVSFSDLMQRVRRQLADYYLFNTDLEMGEIAARLGYREQSSFSNAYKSWTGQSPMQQRSKPLKPMLCNHLDP